MGKMGMGMLGGMGLARRENLLCWGSRRVR